MSRVRALASRGKQLPSDVRRWLSIAATPRTQDGVVVSYGFAALPRRDQLVHGGTPKLQDLAEEFPNAPRGFNVLYLVSSALPGDAAILVRLAHRRGAAIVLNQNGVAYRGWHGPGYERVNVPRARILHAADHVLYQSEFCRLSADRFYGKRRGPSEVLHNAVDTQRFTPARVRRERQLTLLLGGTQYQRYRLQTALETLAHLPSDSRLLVTGALSWEPDRDRCRRDAERAIRDLRLEGRVDFVGPYTQRDAPELFRKADVLLHTKYNDPCPTVVLEAMACGLPVAYSASGGTPELVGGDAGIGLEAPLDWEQDHPPDPILLAGAVGSILERPDDFAQAARARAEQFDVVRWRGRHHELFENLR